MVAAAIYHTETMDDGRIVHAVDTDHGSFVVSCKEVGVAVQNLLNSVTSMDIKLLHAHLLYAFSDALSYEEAMENQGGS